ncbi:MAG TPA: M23 family peptidase [Porphyromonadaceae bacterium]|jgi:hypothetical protein|nr:M23 family peptidase [Porphyromonadaceae bacterium]HBX21503.1 M23 family peptidase [Porphyromonadaceae bacterium]
MNHCNKYILVSLLCLSIQQISYSQKYIYPVDIPPALSANFGELRGNHFHSGIDFKTQQVQNKLIIAIEDGYVSRISVSPGGYGLALYIDHPATGHTSVYGHLNSFSKKIADYVKRHQYEQESFAVDLYPSAGDLPVKRGEQVALSGNTGGSAGPHLHFEIRDTRTQDPLDALAYLPKIADTQKPDLRGIAIYPVQGKGIVNGGTNPLRLTVRKDKTGNPLPPAPVHAWGRIFAGVKAYDRMNGQQNIYGVKFVRLFVDDKLIFSSAMNRFPFEQTRMINSFVDFEEWRQHRAFFMKSVIEPGNTLPLYPSAQNGYIDITEERDYRLRYELEDHSGNMRAYSFTITGKKQSIPSMPACKNPMDWNQNNWFIHFGFLLNIPPGNLYSSICFQYNSSKAPGYYSDVHQAHTMPVPLHKSASMWIKLNADVAEKRNRYGVVRIDRNGSDSWIGGKYEDGGIEVSIRELGDRYAVSEDSIAPKIISIEPEKWASAKRIRVRLTDDKSGIASFRGEIDGKFVLFTHDVKSSVYTYLFDNERLERGKRHTFVFTASDGVGNTAEYRQEFNY